jgi:hypothetical protein
MEFTIHKVTVTNWSMEPHLTMDELQRQKPVRLPGAGGRSGWGVRTCGEGAE